MTTLIPSNTTSKGEIPIVVSTGDLDYSLVVSGLEVKRKNGGVIGVGTNLLVCAHVTHRRPHS